jgi:hypothetical protein
VLPESPPDVRDPVAAVTACSRCQPRHIPALTYRGPWPIPPLISPYKDDGGDTIWPTEVDPD